MNELKLVGDVGLFRAHDTVNVLVFFFVLALPYVGENLLVQNYQLGKLMHLLGLFWFFGGLIFSSFALSRLVWSQPELDHDKLAFGYRVILVLEFFCIPSVALIAYGGMVMTAQIGGLQANAWAYHGYLFLLGTPPILMIIPRFYHKRLIRHRELDIAREQRLALWQDWAFIGIMSILIGLLSASMIFKQPLI